MKRHRSQTIRIISFLAATVEVVEPRRLLSVTWSGSGDGKNWNDAKNWTGGAIPVAADDVTISVSTGKQIVIAGNPEYPGGVTLVGGEVIL